MCKWALPSAWAWPEAHCVANWPNRPWLSVLYARNREIRRSEVEDDCDGSATCGCNCGIMPNGPSELDFLAFCRLAFVSNVTTLPVCLLLLSSSLAFFFLCPRTVDGGFAPPKASWRRSMNEPQLKFTTIWVKRFDRKKIARTLNRFRVNLEH